MQSTLDLGPVFVRRSGSEGDVAVNLSRSARVRSMVAHERVSDGKEEWLTPKEITDVLGPFDLDPCSPIVRPWNTAAKHYTILDDGLKCPWFGRVWLNPPYGAEIDKWMRLMAVHQNGIALTFARTETMTWFENVWPAAEAILFIKGRLAFCHVDGRRSGTSAGAPSCLIAYGSENAKRLETCGIPGRFVRL